MRPRPLVGVALAVLTMGLGGTLARAAPRTKASPVATDGHYDGPRLTFTVPAGATVKDASDVNADYALDLVARPGSALERVPLRLLVVDKPISDEDIESSTTAQRDARLRSRASWGVRKISGGSSDWTQLGGRRFLRLVDPMGSVLGAARQILLCGALQHHLVCGVATAQPDQAGAAQAFLASVLSGLRVKR